MTSTAPSRPVDLDPAAERLAELVDRLTLEDKVRLLTGQDFWATWPLEKIGLRRLVLSDGPSGVRGEVWDERDPSLNLPSATALAAPGIPSIARRYGNVAAVEARRKGVDVVLGPTINLHRSPLGGRHFECFSEDPVLTAELAAAYVTGVQENGVAATPKHYIANDFETDRFTVDVEVDDRTLRELYLLAFEKAIVEARAWLVMSSYNSVNGATVTENDLLETPLNSEWGFDGVVVSDWTAVRSVNSRRALAGPGDARPGRAVGRRAGRRRAGRRDRRGRRRPQGAAHPAAGRPGRRARTASSPPPPSRWRWRTASPSPGRPRPPAPCWSATRRRRPPSCPGRQALSTGRGDRAQRDVRPHPGWRQRHRAAGASGHPAAGITAALPRRRSATRWVRSSRRASRSSRCPR